MTTNLKTNEIVEAAISLIVAKIGTTITFAPVVVQEGDLSFYVEDIALGDLPAVYVKAERIGIHIGGDDQDLSDITGDLVGTRTQLRVVMVGQWAAGTNVVDLRTQYAEELAQVFILSAGDLFNMNATISGFDILRALPVGIETDPPERIAASLNEDRQVYAVAVTVVVEGRSARA